MEKVQIQVKGRVQGVGFRFMTKMVADKLGITGLVRNQEDGSVYIEASGESDSLASFIQQIKACPTPSGRVDQCLVTEDKSLKDYHTFKVTY